jgi:hypothetical protein
VPPKPLARFGITSIWPPQCDNARQLSASRIRK